MSGLVMVPRRWKGRRMLVSGSWGGSNVTMSLPAEVELPEEKPWLLTSHDDIMDELMDRCSYTKAWLKDHPFPGRDSSHDAKVEWLAAIDEEFQAEIEGMSYYVSTAPPAHEIASEVLLKAAPDWITVEIHVRRDELDQVKDLTEEQKKQFAAGLNAMRDEYHGEANWEAFKKWILENDKSNEETVVLSTINCHKDSKLIECTKTFATQLGIADLVTTMHELKSVWEACRDWEMMDLVGKNLYYLRRDKGECFFPLVMRLKALTDSEKISMEFRKSLDDIKSQLESSDSPKTYLFVRKDPDEEDTPATAETRHVLWLPAEFEAEDARITPHFLDGEGESVAFQRGRMGGGIRSTSNARVILFKAELQYTKTIKSWSTKFCAALALTRVAACNSNWITDTEDPDDVYDLIKDLARYWRTTLLRKDDKTLGIGLGENESNANKIAEVSEARKALMRLLETFGGYFESASVDYDSTIKFNVKLGHSRNPLAPNALNKKTKLEK